MMKIFITTVFVVSVSCFGQLSATDKKALELVNKEIEAAERVYKNKRDVQSAYRIFTARVEQVKLIKKDIVSKEINKKNSGFSRSDNKLQRHFKKIQSLGSFIEKNDSGLRNRGDFYLIYGLVVYEFDEDSSRVPTLLKKSMKYSSDDESKAIASGKIADYYFNKSKFAQAVKYYQNSLKLQFESDWTYRYLYNLSWSYFRQQKTPEAIESLLKLKQTGDKNQDYENYYYKQTLARIPHFYIYAEQPDRGFAFLVKERGANGAALFDFVSQVYEKGFFRKIKIYYEKSNELLSVNEEERATFRLSLYNFISETEYKKDYSLLTSMRTDISQDIQAQLLSSDQIAGFVSSTRTVLNNNLGIINRETFSYSNHRDKNYLNNSLAILAVLVIVDPKRSHEYNEATIHLYVKATQFKEAAQLAVSSYDKFRDVDTEKASRFLEIYFPLEENLKKDTIPKGQHDRYRFYLKNGKNKEIKYALILRSFDYHLSMKSDKEAFSDLKSFRKNYNVKNKDLEITEQMVLKLATFMLMERSDQDFEQLKKYVVADAQLYQRENIKKAFSKGQKSVALKKINQLSEDDDKPKDERANALMAIYSDSSLDSETRMLAGYNAGVLFAQLGLSKQSANAIIGSLSQAQGTQLQAYTPKAASISTQLFLQGSSLYSFHLLDKIYRRSCSQDKESSEHIIKNIFEILVLEKRYDAMEKYLKSFDRCKISIAVRGEIIQILLSYVDYNNPRDFRGAVSIIENKAFAKTNGQDLLTSKYLVYLLNQNFQLTPRTLDTIEKDFEKYNLLRSPLGKELAQLNKRLSSLKSFDHKNTVNSKNINAVIDSSFMIVEGNLKIISKNQFKALVIIYLAELADIFIFEQFVHYLSSLNIEESSNEQSFSKILSGVSDPIEKKVKRLKDNVYQMLEQEFFFIKHVSFHESDQFTPAYPVVYPIVPQEERL